MDLTRIDGIDVMVAQTLLSEVGLDMSRWKTEAHFASWLGLCPDNRISGDKVLGKGTRRVVNRAATALRMAANALIRSRTYLGAQYRRLRTKLGAPKAITAMAHRLARLVYRMLKYGQRYVDKGTEYYEMRYRRQQIEFLRKKQPSSGSRSCRHNLEVVSGEGMSREKSPRRLDADLFSLGIQPSCLNVHSRSESGLPQNCVSCFASAHEAEICFLFPLVPFRCRNGANRFLKQQA